MAENDQYPDNNHGTFAPVGFILVIAIAVVLGIFVFARSQGPGVPDAAPGAPTGTTGAANPAQPVVPGTNIPASPNGAN